MMARPVADFGGATTQLLLPCAGASSVRRVRQIDELTEAWPF